jgi:hypothetical protein
MVRIGWVGIKGRADTMDESGFFYKNTAIVILLSWVYKIRRRRFKFPSNPLSREIENENS